MTKHNHYFKDVTHLKCVDVYRVLALFNVTDPCLQHAIKKLLVAGGRGAGKDVTQDITEAKDSLERFLEMRAEDADAGKAVTRYTVGMDSAWEMVTQAIDVLSRNAPPNGLSDKETVIELTGIFDSPLQRKAEAERKSFDAAVAQGVDLVSKTTEELSRARAAMPLFREMDKPVDLPKLIEQLRSKLNQPITDEFATRALQQSGYDVDFAENKIKMFRVTP